MRCNQAGIILIKHFEGCVLVAYKDQGGVWTIGWGHTGPEVHEGLVWSQEQADAMLLQDLWRKAERPVNFMVSADLNENQFSALCALVYNIGSGAFGMSTLLRDINSGDFQDAPYQIKRWHHVHGVDNDGLRNRCAAEVALWGTPC